MPIKYTMWKELGGFDNNCPCQIAKATMDKPESRYGGPLQTPKESSGRNDGVVSCIITKSLMFC